MNEQLITSMMNHQHILESAHDSLLKASNDLHIRSEVSSLLTSLLTDIETQQTLQKEYKTKKQISKLDHKFQNTQNELLERRAIHYSTLNQRQELCDKFIGELFVLSLQMQELNSWKEANFEKVQRYDQLKRDLERAEESVRTFKRSVSLNANANAIATVPNRSSSTNTLKENSESVKAPTGADLETSCLNEETLDSKKSVDIDNVTEKNIIKTDPNQTTEVNDNTAVAKPSSKNKIKKKKIVPKSKDINKKKKYPKASLVELKDDILLEIFACLDAIEVIQAAQVNKQFYLRINAMFGNVSSVQPDDSVVVIDEDSENDSESESESEEGSYETDDSDVSESDTDNDTDTDSDSEDETEKTSEQQTQTSKSNIKPTMVSIPTKTEASTKSPNLLSNMFSNIMNPNTNTLKNTSSDGATKTRNTTALSGLTDNMVSSLTSKLTPNELSVILSLSDNVSQLAAEVDSLTTRLETSTSNSKSKNSEKSSIADGKSNPTGLTAGMANSMTSKLNPSELAVIISMTEKISRITAEREDLAARLEGTEAVKEFLISKVRNTEKALANQQSEKITITQKTSSDQEIIAFLDGRVQELEHLYKDCSISKSKVEEGFKNHIKSSKEKTKVIEDMLQFERQQLADQEKEWKMTKKVLVKEVKHCRAQITTLQEERDKLYEHNQRLKQALLTLNGDGMLDGGL